MTSSWSLMLQLLLDLLNCLSDWNNQCGCVDSKTHVWNSVTEALTVVHEQLLGGTLALYT